jgi:hypothetical protein
MQTESLIAIKEFCVNHNIEISFISLLHQSGLIEITTIEETGYINADQLSHLEKITHLYYELDINLEGIEAINHLLNKIESLQDEINSFKNRLRFYETND